MSRSVVARWAGWALAIALVVPSTARAQDGAALVAQAQRDWQHLNTASAIRGFERATADPNAAADAWLGLGRIRAFRGWQAEGAFPGWHEEVDQRPLALAAYQRAADLKPTWAEPHVALGEALLLDGRSADALAAFDRALAVTPGHPAATRGRAIARGEKPADPEADAIARIDAAVKAGPPADAAAQARAFIAASPGSPRVFDAYARLLSTLQGWKESPSAELLPTIDARIALRPDPLAYAAAVNLLVARNVALDRARSLAAAGLEAGDRFITENEPSYKLGGKVQNSRDRNRGQFTDLLGWIAFLQGDTATAARQLDEAARFVNGNDFLNQFHRAQLAKAAGDSETARERYYEALSLESAPPLAPLRQAAEASLTAIYVAEGTSADDTKANIARELERRRDERRRALLSSAVGKALPALPTTDLTGAPANLAGRPGQVILLNFFAAWCGACRQEIPMIQQAWERYKDDPSVRFVLVSLDDDPKRLERYVAERKFQMPVLRMTREQAAAALDVQDTPWTFYVDAAGTIRYEVRGLEPHGDAVARISWYLDQLKGDKASGQ
jgi:peroxiredoxin